MSKKPDSGARQAQRSDARPATPIEDELRELYASYGEGAASPRMKGLASKLADAIGKQKPQGAGAKAKKIQTAE